MTAYYACTAEIHLPKPRPKWKMSSANWAS